MLLLVLYYYATPYNKNATRDAAMQTNYHLISFPTIPSTDGTNGLTATP